MLIAKVAEFIVRLKLWLMLCPPLSFTVTVTVVVPSTEGVPLIIPVKVTVSPEGSPVALQI